MNYSFLEWILLSIFIATGILVGLVLLRELIRSAFRMRLKRRSRACRQLINSYQKKQFEDINKLLFYLKDSYDPEVVEHVLREFIAQDDPMFRSHLREVYSFLQLTQQYINELESVRWRERAEAAFMLGQIGDPQAVPHLVARMKDPDEDEQNVKMACAQALGLIRDPAAIPDLIEALEDVNQWSSVKVAELLVWFGKTAIPALQEALTSGSGANKRMWAAQILGAIGDSSAVPVLTQRLRDRDPNVRIAAVEALGRLQSPLAVHAIIDLLLRDPVAEVRGQAAIALGQIADDRALKPLVNALNDPEYWTRVRAVEALEVLGGEHVSELERLIFFDPRIEVRRRAAQALERLGFVEQTIPHLLEPDTPEAQRTHRLFVEMARLGCAQQVQGYLKDENIRIRYGVCDILGEANMPALEPALVEASQDTEWVVKIKALGYLARNQSEAALLSLQRALEEADPIQRPLVVATLKQLNRTQLEHFSQQLLLMANDENIETRVHAIELLAQFPSEETQAALTPCLRDPVAEVRQATVESLSLHNDPSITPYLTNMLDDPDRKIRLKVCSVLGRLQDPRAIDGLIQAFEGADAESRRVIADSLARFGLDHFYERLDELMGLDSLDIKIGICWVLGQTGDKRATRILSFFLKDNHPSLRSAALGSLGRIHDRSAAVAVLPALQDVNKQVRTSAVNALLRIGIAEGLSGLSELLSDPDPFVRCRAAISLGKLDNTGIYEEQMLSLLRKETNTTCRDFFLVGIGLIPTSSSLKLLLPQFHQASVRRRLFAILDKEEANIKAQFLDNLGLGHLEYDSSEGALELLQEYAQELQQSQNPERRKIAIEAMGILAHKDAAPYLQEALYGDPDENLRQASARAMSQIGEQWPEICPQIQEGLLKGLTDPVPAVAEAVLYALAPIADESVGDDVYPLLMSKSKNVRVAARALLLQLHRHHPQTYLDRVDKSETPELQAAGLSLLGNLQGPKVIAYLLKVLRHPDRTLRLNATRALGGHSDNEEVIAALHQARQDPSADVRVWSIRVLSRWDDEETLLQLAAHSRDPSPSVRLAILPALEKAHHPETLQTIAALASDPSEEVRTRALAALIEQGERTAIDLFLQELNRYPHHVQEQIQAHLEQSQQLARIAQRAQLDLEPNRRWGALVVLAALAPHQHISIFIEALKDPAPEVRREATRLLLPLLHTSDPQYAGVFDRLQRDPDHEIQSILRHHQTTLY